MAYEGIAKAAAKKAGAKRFQSVIFLI